MVSEQELLDLIATNLKLAIELNEQNMIETFSSAYQRVKSVQTQTLGDIK